MWNGARTRKERESKGKGTSSIRLGLQKEIPWEKEHHKVRVLRDRKLANIASLLERVFVSKGMSVITCIHLSASFFKMEVANFGINVLFQHAEQTGGEPKKRSTSAIVSNTLGMVKKSLRCNQMRTVTLHDDSGIPLKFILRGVRKVVVSKFRPSRVEKRKAPLWVCNPNALS